MRWLPLLLLLIGCIAAGSGCAELGRAGEPTVQAPPVRLPRLPDDGPYWTRSAAEVQVSELDGIDTFDTSGAPAVATHPTQASWLRLDGDLATGGLCWAIWRLPLTPETTIEQIRLNLPQTGFARYWLAYADYDANRWQFLPTTHAEGLQGSAPTITPENEAALHSPGHNAYIALLVLPGHAVNVAWVELTADAPGPLPPIADAFEPNDSLDNCWMLEAGGPYRASIRQSPILPDWPNPDKFDFYCVNIPAGKQLTVTLRFEVFDHLADPEGFRYENDLDLLFYPANATDPLNDFIESESSQNTFFYPFEQIHFTGSGLWKFGVLGDEDTGVPDSNAEYDLHVFLSDATYEVSGKVTQEGGVVNKRFAVYLEPGNFNAFTLSEPGKFGDFNIEGVPDGPYTLKVEGSVGYNQAEYIYPETKEVVVASGNVENVFIDLSAFPN